MGLKLNLGSGQHSQPGFVNVDKFGEPDLKCDLEVFPWPWPENSVSEILLIHVLEHLGAKADTFIGIMKEMYRVCEPGAKIRIVVPHPRHDDFLNDPTHVRPVTHPVLELFSRQKNLLWKETGAANTPLALYHNVDFEVVEARHVLDEPYSTQLQNRELGSEDLQGLLRKYNNVVKESHFTLEVIKNRPEA